MNIILGALKGEDAPWWVAIAVAFISGGFSVYKILKQSRDEKQKDRVKQDEQLSQRREEMRRDQCSRGLKMVDAMLVSNDQDEEYYSWDAMKILDYKDERYVSQESVSGGGAGQVVRGFKTKLKGVELVDDGAFRQAMIEGIENIGDENRARLLLFVRECFDEFYFRMGQLEDAIAAGLVTFEDVKTPVDYYVGLMAMDAAIHADYMGKNGYEKTLSYLGRFDSWAKARRSLDPILR